MNELNLSDAAAALTRAIRAGRFAEASLYVERYRETFDEILAGLPENSDQRRGLVREATDLFLWAKHEAEVSRAHLQARLGRTGQILSYAQERPSLTSRVATEG